MRGLLTAIAALLVTAPAMNAETVLCKYENGTMTNVTISGTTKRRKKISSHLC